MTQERQPISTVGVGSVDRRRLNERNQTAPRAGGEGWLRAVSIEKSPDRASA